MAFLDADGPFRRSDRPPLPQGPGLTGIAGGRASVCVSAFGGCTFHADLA